jgi:DNA-binding LacI/PurR family transcriptional regulator
VGGFLLVGAFVDATITTALGDKCPPIVLVDGYSDTNNYDAVVSDNFQASYDAVKYLIQQGTTISLWLVAKIMLIQASSNAEMDICGR